MVLVREFQAYSLSDIEGNIDKVKNFLMMRDSEDLKSLLVQKSDKPAIYLYKIEYTHPHTGNRECVHGIVSLMQVDQPDKQRQVFGHERIFPKRAEELCDCFSQCHVQFNPIVVIYKDYSKLNDELLQKTAEMEPIIDAKIDVPEAHHQVWAFYDKDLIERVKKSMVERRVIVADGHHRYKAAELMGSKNGAPWIMTMFVDANNPGLLLFPWHRVLKSFDMEKFLDRLYNPVFGFKVYEAKAREDMLAALGIQQKEEIEARLMTGRPPNLTKGAWQCISKNTVYFGLQFKGRDKYYLITIDDLKVAEMASRMGEKICLELTLLHIWLVNNIIPKATPVEYLSTIKEVDAAINDGYELAIYLPPMTKDDIILKALWEKKPVPEKATCFRPKAKTGVIFWKIPEVKKAPKA